jgi:hypothetical protein
MFLGAARPRSTQHFTKAWFKESGDFFFRNHRPQIRFALGDVHANLSKLNFAALKQSELYQTTLYRYINDFFTKTL